MKPVYSYFTPKLKGFAAILTVLLLAACGTYNNTQMEDGIYGTETTVETSTEVEEAISENKNSYYQQYFKTKVQNLEEIPEESNVFTDIDAYSTYETMDEEGYIVEKDYEEHYGSWGENNTDVSINVYNNGWGNYNYWNYGYYNYWGYNNYFFRPGWAIGYGYGGWGAFNYGWGWNGGFYGGFNPYWGIGVGYYGNPYCYNSPYNYGGYYNNSYAYQGTRNSDRGRSSYDYSSRRNTRDLGRNTRSSYNRNSTTGRRDNSTLRNSSNARRATYPNARKTTTQRPTRANTNTSRSNPNVRTRPSTTRTRPNVQSSRRSSSSRSSGNVRSSSSTRSSGASRSSGSSRSSRRGGGK